MPVQDPVELVKKAWERFATGGAPAALALCAHDLVWVPHDGGEYRGSEALLERFRARAVKGIRVEPIGHRFEDHGDCVVVVGRVRVLGPDGHYDVPMNWQVDVRDGLITRIQAERRVEDARADCADSSAAA